MHGRSGTTLVLPPVDRFEHTRNCRELAGLATVGKTPISRLAYRPGDGRGVSPAGRPVERRRAYQTMPSARLTNDAVCRLSSLWHSFGPLSSAVTSS